MCSLNKSIAELEKTMGEEGSKLEGHKGLSSINGIGAILLNVIGDVNDFADEGQNSNATEHSGRIDTDRGQLQPVLEAFLRTSEG